MRFHHLPTILQCFILIKKSKKNHHFFAKSSLHTLIVKMIFYFLRFHFQIIKISFWKSDEKNIKDVKHEFPFSWKQWEKWKARTESSFVCNFFPSNKLQKKELKECNKYLILIKCEWGRRGALLIDPLQILHVTHLNKP